MQLAAALLLAATAATHVVTAQTAGDGEISPTTQTVRHAGDAVVSVTPAPGSATVAVTGDTCAPANHGDGLWVIAEVTDDCVVTARFDKASGGRHEH